MALSKGRLVLSDLTEFLVCPVCGEELVASGSVLACANRHSFDIARQGYVNLLRGSAKPGTADTADMARARAAFLAAGHYDPLVSAVAGAAAVAARCAPGCILDAGAGTGHYLAAVLDALPDRVGLALDISKEAAKLASRAHRRAGVVVADSWGALPVRTGVAAAVLDVFAPRNLAEFRRVLAPGGGLVIVTPNPEHLAELVSALGLVTVDERKEARLAETTAGIFELESSRVVESALSLTHDEALSLVCMGPSARHAGDDLAMRVAELPRLFSATLSARVAIYRAATPSAG